jgi:hypothetical protein
MSEVRNQNKDSADAFMPCLRRIRAKAEFVTVHRAVDERVSVQALDLDVNAVASQEGIGGGESDALPPQWSKRRERW